MSSLKQWLKNKGIAQKELAAQWGVDDGTLSTYILGKTTMPPEIQANFEGMKYFGPWPKPERDEARRLAIERALKEEHPNMRPSTLEYTARKAMEIEWAKTGKVMPADLKQASDWVDELVIQGRKDYDEEARWDWVHLVSERIAELRALGKQDEAREKIEQLVRVAKGPIGGELPG